MTEHTIEITALAHGGDGIGRANGQVCFVRQALPGDVVRVRVTRTAAQALWAEIAEVLTPSPHRTEPVCPNFAVSGEASWAHFAYPAQAEWKRRIVQETLARIGGIEAELDWRENPELRTGYRTRAVLHGDGARFGFFAPGSHKVVDTESSALCHPRLNAALRQLRKLKLKGTVTVTVNPEGEETLVWTKFTQRRLKDRFPLANTPKDTGKRAAFFFDGVPIVNGAFSQSSLLLNRLLVDEVRRLAGSPSNLLDLYCGNGNLSLQYAGRIPVTGVDQNKAAIKAAGRAAKQGQTEYRAGDEAMMRKLIAQDEWDTIVLDPPRAGAKALMETLAPTHARAIVYVSCEPATLARDLGMLAGGGWRVARGTAIDMFPHTPHIETAVRLERAEGTG